MTPEELKTEMRLAYDSRSRERMEWALSRLGPKHVQPERIMELWNEAIDDSGSNILRFANLLIRETTRHYVLD